MGYYGILIEIIYSTHILFFKIDFMLFQPRPTPWIRTEAYRLGGNQQEHMKWMKPF